MQENQTHTYLVCTAILIVALFGVAYFSTEGTITGAVVTATEEEEGKEESAERTKAFEALLQAAADIEAVKKLNLSTHYLEDLQLQAQYYYIGESNTKLLGEAKLETNTIHQAYIKDILAVADITPAYEVKQRDYKKVLDYTKKITEAKEAINTLLDSLTLVAEKERKYKEQKIDTTEGKKLLEETKVSFKEERYQEALRLLQEAETALDAASTENKRVKELTKLSKNIFMNYWWQIIIIFALIFYLTPAAITTIRKRRAENKYHTLSLELQTLQDLLKKAQLNCFKHKIISQETYKLRAQRYKQRITKIKHTLPVLESILEGKKKKNKRKKEY